MIRSRILLFLLFCSCSEIQNTKNEPSEKLPIAMEDSSIVLKADSQATAIDREDTLFLFRERRKKYDHAVFVEPNKNSKYRNYLTNFSFDEYDQGSYNSMRQSIEEKHPGVYKKFNMEELSQNWLPLYRYKGHYYLYAPSDWGAACRRIVNNKEFMFWYMTGPTPYPLTAVKRTSKHQYELSMLDPFRDTIAISQVHVHIIDPITKMAVFEYKEEGSSSYELLIPVEHSDQFDMVVNYCRTQKQPEYEFERIDFKKLLNKSK